MAERLNGIQEASGSTPLGSIPRGSNSVVECDLAKVEVAGSNPVSRFRNDEVGTLNAELGQTQFIVQPSDFIVYTAA